LRSEIVEK